MEDVERASKPFNIHWLNAAFLLGTPPLALGAAIWHGYSYGITWVEGLIFFVWYYACGLSITVGYHRLFTHRSHEAIWPLRLSYALFGAGAFQNSILEWSSDHRNHHKEVDTAGDPYSAAKGFWWSHFLWIIFDEHEGKHDYSNVRDLQKDWVVRLQHRFIFSIGFLVGMVLPAAVGYAIGGVGTAVGGFVWGGLVRTVFVHHGTFLINSAAHVWGKQPYATNNSSKDSTWLAFFTFGEGYHNFHHTFQADYRNGHRWWQWDPSKWWISAFSFVKMNRNLKKTPKWAIETARMETKFSQAAADASAIHDSKEMSSFQLRSKECCEGLRMAQRQFESMRQQFKRASDESREQFAVQMKQARKSIQQMRDDFTRLLDEMCNATTPSVA
jgi:stearoyl-CoA desaturase (delta-9 desaturase)